MIKKYFVYISPGYSVSILLLQRTVKKRRNFYKSYISRFPKENYFHFLYWEKSDSFDCKQIKQEKYDYLCVDKNGDIISLLDAGGTAPARKSLLAIAKEPMLRHKIYLFEVKVPGHTQKVLFRYKGSFYQIMRYVSSSWCKWLKLYDQHRYKSDCTR